MQQYLDLLKDIKEKGTYKPAAREGMPGTQSLFGYQFRHNLADGFPLLTTKKMYWKGIVAELIWFLRGDTNIKYLDEQGVRKMWHEDAYNYYCKIACVNGGTDLNAILQPVSTKELGTRTPKPENVDSYSMFTFEEFMEKIKNTSREELPQYKGYTLGDCGYQYGKVWRDWNFVDFKIDPKQNGDSYHRTIDQIKNVINSLMKSPEGRRHIVSAIDPAHDTDLALYWCHAMFQFNCRPLTEDERIGYVIENFVGVENASALQKPIDWKKVEEQFGPIPKYYLDCQLYQRSADVILGVPFNIASYALLTNILAKMCNMIPGEFIHTFGDVHIYDNHRAAVEEQLSRTPGKLPKLEIGLHFKDFDVSQFKYWLVEDFQIKDYNPQSKIEAGLSTGMKK